MKSVLAEAYAGFENDSTFKPEDWKKISKEILNNESGSFNAQIREALNYKNTQSPDSGSQTVNQEKSPEQQKMEHYKNMFMAWEEFKAKGKEKDELLPKEAQNLLSSPANCTLISLFIRVQEKSGPDIGTFLDENSGQTLANEENFKKIYLGAAKPSDEQRTNKMIEPDELKKIENLTQNYLKKHKNPFEAFSSENALAKLYADNYGDLSEKEVNLMFAILYLDMKAYEHDDIAAKNVGALRKSYERFVMGKENFDMLDERLGELKDDQMDLLDKKEGKFIESLFAKNSRITDDEIKMLEDKIHYIVNPPELPTSFENKIEEKMEKHRSFHLLNNYYWLRYKLFKEGGLEEQKRKKDEVERFLMTEYTEEETEKAIALLMSPELKDELIEYARQKGM